MREDRQGASMREGESAIMRWIRVSQGPIGVKSPFPHLSFPHFHRKQLHIFIIILFGRVQRRLLL